MTDGAALPQRVADLRSRVRERKKRIRQERSALQSDASRLAELEEECRKRGIQVVVQRQE